jgi:uncharacterized protein (DUF488 family)
MPTVSPPAADPPAGGPILTVGHSNRTAEEFLELLQAHGVRALVDVRSLPGSRRNPQFAAAALAATLASAGIVYRHEPGLGGLRRPRPDSANTAWQNASFRGYADYMETDVFAERLEILIATARPGTVLMCAEAVPWRCHRSLLADALLARAVPVRHILSATHAEPHRLTAFACVENGRVSYPGVV